MKFQPKENIAWIDLLRIIACVLVVISHSCDPYVAQLDNIRPEFLSGAIIGSFMRISVPLFVMITGILSLPIRHEMGTFYRKKIGRIAIPIAIWSLLLPLIYFAYFQFFSSASPAAASTDFSIGATLSRMWTFVFNFNYTTIPLWYLYMLIGLYLIMPIVSAWLKQATQKDIKLFLYIWIATLIIPYLKMLLPLIGYNGPFGSVTLFGVCDWNTYGSFYYVSGFIGYIVLAYYLVQFPFKWSLKKTLAICLPTFAVGYAITTVGFILTQKYYPGDFAALEIVWYFTGINVFMMTVSMFLIVQKINIKPSKTLSHLASCTFGIYLCHFVFVQMGYDMINRFSDVPPAVRIFMIAIVATIISYGVVVVLKTNKITKRFVD